jgi:NIMA (never in mitosis gene a)-related kinase
LGVILFEICALKPPFDANNLTALALRISKGEYESIPGHYSEELKKIIADLLIVDPAKRPSIN